jgi:hypothetical protein
VGFRKQVEMRHDVSKLPLWVKELIGEKNDQIRDLKRKLKALEEAHAILHDREWFALPGPAFKAKEDRRYLWSLNRDNPACICALGKGDVLMIGRKKQ